MWRWGWWVGGVGGRAGGSGGTGWVHGVVPRQTQQLTLGLAYAWFGLVRLNFILVRFVHSRECYAKRYVPGQKPVCSEAFSRMVPK